MGLGSHCKTFTFTCASEVDVIVAKVLVGSGEIFDWIFSRRFCFLVNSDSCVTAVASPLRWNTPTGSEGSMYQKAR